MEILKDISKDHKQAAQELFTYISTFETEIVILYDNFHVENLSQNCALKLSIAIVNMAIECCSGLYDELLSVEYGKFEEQDVDRYNWLCKVRKHLENNFEDGI